MGIEIRDWDWALGFRIGIGDWIWELLIMIGDLGLGLRLGSGIEDLGFGNVDWRLDLEIRIGHWD